MSQRCAGAKLETSDQASTLTFGPRFEIQGPGMQVSLFDGRPLAEVEHVKI